MILALYIFMHATTRCAMTTRRKQSEKKISYPHPHDNARGDVHRAPTHTNPDTKVVKTFIWRNTRSNYIPKFTCAESIPHQQRKLVFLYITCHALNMNLLINVSVLSFCACSTYTTQYLSKYSGTRIIQLRVSAAELS